MVTKIRRDQYSGMSSLFETGPKGLAHVIRGIAVDNARTRVAAANLSALVDNTGGAKGQVLANLVVPAAAIDATSAGGVSASALNTSLGKLRNVQKSLAGALNAVRVKLGLPIVYAPEGTATAALPAMDQASTAAAGSSAADFASTQAALQAAKTNVLVLAYATNEVVVAMGDTPVVSRLSGQLPQNPNLVVVPSVTASAAGPSSAAKTDVDAFLAALGGDVSTMAVMFNEAINQVTAVQLTDNTGGSATAYGTDVVGLILATPLVGHQDASTDSLGATAYNAVIAAQSNALASISSALNLLLEESDKPLTTDNTGGTVSTTLAAEPATLTPVTGVNSASLPSVQAAVGAFANDVATLARQVNSVVDKYGVTRLLDQSGGTPSVSQTLVAIPPTVGVDDTAGPYGVQETAFNAVLVTMRNAVAALAAKVNAMSAQSTSNGLHVIAA